MGSVLDGLKRIIFALQIATVLTAPMTKPEARSVIRSNIPLGCHDVSGVRRQPTCDQRTVNRTGKLNVSLEQHTFGTEACSREAHPVLVS